MLSYDGGKSNDHGRKRFGFCFLGFAGLGGSICPLKVAGFMRSMADSV